MAIVLVSNKSEKQVKIFFLKVAACLTIMGFLLSACSPSFPSVESMYVSPYALESTDFPALSPDGASLTLSDFTNIDLQSGTESRPFDAYIPADWHRAYHQIQWSPEQTQFAVEASTSDSGLSLDNPVFVIDTKSQQLSELSGIREIYQWSPFGKRLLGKPKQTFFWQVYDLDQQSFIPLPFEGVNPAKEKNVKGAGMFLWNGKLNIPIAEISQINPVNFSGVIAPQEVGVNSLLGNKNGEIESDFSSYVKKFVSSPPDNIVDAKFDPTGEFILVVQWKCSQSDIKQCSLYPSKEYFGNITDTALILIRWHTGEQKELIRLSQIDTQSVIANYAEWSADGSTIFISRKDALPIVLKVK